MRAQGLHHVELALGAVEAAPERGIGRAFEIAERLVELAGEPQIGGDAANGGRRAVVIGEVVLEKLIAVEARGGDRFELFPQRPAHRNGGYRPTHHPSALSVRPVSLPRY